MSPMERNADLHVLTYRHVSPITWPHFMTSTEEPYVNCSHLTSTTTRTTSLAAKVSITSVLWYVVSDKLLDMSFDTNVLVNYYLQGLGRHRNRAAAM